MQPTCRLHGTPERTGSLFFVPQVRRNEASWPVRFGGIGRLWAVCRCSAAADLQAVTTREHDREQHADRSIALPPTSGRSPQGGVTGSGPRVVSAAAGGPGCWGSCRGSRWL